MLIGNEYCFCYILTDHFRLRQDDGVMKGHQAKKIIKEAHASKKVMTRYSAPKEGFKLSQKRQEGCALH